MFVHAATSGTTEAGTEASCSTTSAKAQEA
jgi:hypothetical protein